MTEPVLVVHGVANRDRGVFERLVSDLQGRIDSTLKLIPVFWGDLGAATNSIADTIPEVGARSDVSIAPVLAVSMTSPGVHPLIAAGNLDRAAVIADASGSAMMRTRGLSAAPAAAPDSAGLASAIRAELPNTTYLRLTDSEAVLRAVGDSIGAGLARSRSTAPEIAAVPSLPDTSLIGSLLHDADRLVGAVLGDVFGTFNQFLRTALVPNVTEAVGDVFAYEHKRDEIQGRLWAAIDTHAPGYGVPAKPIHVVGHSLGGVIAFQAATSKPAGTRALSVDGLVTFGCQAPYFHVLDPEGSVIAAYSTGNPVTIPSSVRRWTNLWEPLDPLAFIAAKVFRLDSGAAPLDMATAHLASSGLWTHSSYWSCPELVAEINRTLIIPAAVAVDTTPS